jgi:rubrerythrin
MLWNYSITRSIISLMISLAVVFGAYYAGKWQGQKKLKEVAEQQQEHLMEVTTKIGTAYSKRIKDLEDQIKRDQAVVQRGVTVVATEHCPVVTESASRVLDGTSGNPQTIERTVETPTEVATSNETPRVIDPEAVERNREQYETIKSQLEALIEWTKQITK